MFENLEDRRLYSITHGLDASGTLTIQGDYANDVITVQEDKGYLVVSQSAPNLNWGPTYTINTSPSGGGTTLYSSPLNPSPLNLAPPGGYALSAVKKIVIDAGPGADLVAVNSSIATTLFGGSGPDTLYGGFGDDAIDAGTDNDSVHGRDGNDNLDGGAGDDAVRGGQGNDVVTGGAGDDSLFGDDGDDQFTGEAGADSYSGGGGRDTLSYASRVNGVRVFANDGIANDGESSEFDNVSADVEDFTGGWGDDVLVGTPANNVLVGGPGNDNLLGGDGDDRLDGGDDRDWLQGENGSDALLGGRQSDVLEDSGTGTDFYEGGDDRDEVRYIARADDLALSADGVANDGAPGENDMIFSCEKIVGGSGNDTITAGNDTSYELLGGPGNDTLVSGAFWCDMYGQDGDDTFVARNGHGDYMDGGNGNDSASIDWHFLLPREAARWIPIRIADDTLCSVENW